MRKYDLAKMLEEIRVDEAGASGPAKKLLTQEQIKARAAARRAVAKKKPAPK